MHALAFRQAHHLGLEVRRRVVDDLVGAQLAHEPELAGGRRRDDTRAARLRHLHEQSTDAARGGVHERGRVPADGEGARDEIVRRHSLEHRGGGDAEIDGRRELHELSAGTFACSA